MKIMKVVHKKLVIALARVSCFVVCLAAFLWTGCSTVDPRLQHEFTRPGLSEAMLSVFTNQQDVIPEMMATHKIPGLSIAVVDRDGILWAAGFGHTDYDRQIPVTSETLFSIQSMSKTMTATAMMFAVRDGLVELDAPITRYLPSFTVHSRYEESPQDRITIRSLLNHTSGLGRDTSVGNNDDALFPSFEEHIKSISSTWLMYRVGEKISYSNCGFDLAAYILQIQANKTFAEYIKEKLFSPLGMFNSSADIEFVRHHPNRAIGHRKHFKGVPLETPYNGAGGVYINAKDMAKFIQFHLNLGKVNGRPLIDKGNLTRMYTVSSLDMSTALGIGIGVVDNGNCRNPLPADTHTAHTSFVLSHSGSGFGFCSVMGWLPEYGHGMLIMSNSQNDGGQLGLLGRGLLLKLLNNNLIEKDCAFELSIDKKVKMGSLQQPNTDNISPYQSVWKKYIGTYQYIRSGWKMYAYAEVALTLGYPDPGSEIKVYEQKGYFEINGKRLDEHLPGLFFTKNGQCLDLRGPTPTWNNYRIKKSN